MKAVRLAKWAGAATLVWVFGAVAQAQSVRIDGSSTVFPVTEAVAEEFGNGPGKGISVTIGVSGTGGGFKKFVRGESDISNASRPILTEEMTEAAKNGIEYIELPVAFDALTVMVNPRNNWADSLTVAELKKVWEPEAQGVIMNWNQVRDGFPDKPLRLYGAGADSGTFDYFTEAIMAKAKSSRGDFTASEDDNILVQGISGDEGALGFFGYSYYIENKDKLKAVAVDGGDGPVAPSEDTVLNSTYNPLSRPVFIYVSKKSLERPEVVKFVEFYLENVAELAKEVGYVPLPEKLYGAAKERVEKRQTGTVFGGHSEVGLSIEELFQRELKQ